MHAWSYAFPKGGHAMFPRLFGGAVCVALTLLLSSRANAAPFELPDGRVLPRVDFDRHVHALLNKLGCNAGGCHGNEQGKGSFFLSLFSGSPAKDYEEIVRGSRGRRLNFIEPDASLLLVKAVGGLDHGGGMRVLPGSWEYRLVRQWIKEGAERPEQNPVVRLEVTPQEHFFDHSDKSVSPRAVAEFADKSREDVTLFTDFRTPVVDPPVAAVSRTGEVSMLRPGFAPVLAFYRNQVTGIRMLAPWPTLREAKKEMEDKIAEDSSSMIDREIFALLNKLNLPAADLAGDSEFLRRVHIDIVGRLPTAAEVREFLSSKDPQKREKKIETLLNDPLHADLWASRLGEVLRLRSNDLSLSGSEDNRWRQMAHDWLRQRVADNVPMDRMLRDVLLATSREGQPPPDWAAGVTRLEEGPPFGSEYARRQTLDLFWRRDIAKTYLEEMADQVADAFLGVPLECAQCHHHPLGPWSKADRGAFAAVFAQVKVGLSPDAAAAVAKEKRLREEALQAALAKLSEDLEAKTQILLNSMPAGEGRNRAVAQLKTRWSVDRAAVQRHFAMKHGKRTLQEVYLNDVPTRIDHPDTREPLEARSLGGPAIPMEGDARAELFRRLTEGETPWLARAFVNRVWRHYFGRGLVEPDGVFVPANVASHPELLEALTRDFVSGGYDLRRLEKAILLSQTYQRSSEKTPANETDVWFYSHGRPFRPSFAVLLDVMGDALGGHESFVDLPKRKRFIEVAVAVPGLDWMSPSSEEDARNVAMDGLFGRSELASRCRDYGRGRNWGLFVPRSETFADLVKKSKRVQELATSEAPLEKRVEELFLATLSRYPLEKEMTMALDYLRRETMTPPRAWEDLLWALTNTKEFQVRR